MLVLTRRLGDVIHIGDDIRIVIVDLRSSTVMIGIDAPKNVRVLREEIMEVGDEIYTEKRGGIVGTFSDWEVPSGSDFG